MPKWGESQYKAGKAAEDQSRETAALQGFDAVVRSMGVLLDQGKIKAWGLSNETSFGVGAFAAACARLGVAPPVSIQNDFSLCFRTFEGEPHPTSPFEGIALMDVVLRMARLQGEADCPRTGRELLEMTRAARYW